MIGQTSFTQPQFKSHYYFGYKLRSSHKVKLAALNHTRTISILGKRAWEQAYVEAENAFANKHFAKAYQSYKFILDNYAQYFDIAELLFNCGLSARKHGKHELAIKYFEQCFKINPSEEILANIKRTQKLLK